MICFGSTTTRWIPLSLFSATAAILMGAVLACQSPPPPPETPSPGTSAPSEAEPGPVDAGAGAPSNTTAADGKTATSKPSPAKTVAPEVLDGGESLALIKGAQTTGQLRVSLRGIAVPEGSDAPNVIMGMRAGIQDCYQKAAQAGSKWQGTADVSLKVAASGKVESAKVTSTESGFPQALGACMRKQATAARFDKGAIEELTFTAVFKSVP